MQQSLAGVRRDAADAPPHLNTDRFSHDGFHLAQGAGPGPANPPAAAETAIPSFDAQGRPRLVTGSRAVQAATAIAASAWEPSNPHNRTTGRLGEGLRPYASLADQLSPNSDNPIDVVGVYGEIIFAADPSMPRLSQELYLEQAVAAAQRTPPGRRLLDGVAGESGFPIVVRLNDQRANGADFAEDPNAVAPQQAGQPAVRLRSNYDLVYWDPTSAPISVMGHAAPPVMALIHELRHAEQYAAERARSSATTAFPDGVIRQPAAFAQDVDADQNGIKDREDDATDIENAYLRELGLEPLRERYDSGIDGLIEVTGADAVPTAEQIRTFLLNWQLRNQQPGV